MGEEQDTRDYVQRRIQRELSRKAYHDMQRQVEDIERDDKHGPRQALIAYAVLAAVMLLGWIVYLFLL